MELVTQVADNVFYNPAYKVVTIDGIPALEVPQCPGYYLTQEGKLWNPRTEKLALPYLERKRNLRIVEIVVDGNRIRHKGHELLANCFLPKEENKNIIDFKDGDSSNIYLLNLLWRYREGGNYDSIKGNGSGRKKAERTDEWLSDAKNIRKLKRHQTGAGRFYAKDKLKTRGLYNQYYANSTEAINDIISAYDKTGKVPDEICEIIFRTTSTIPKSLLDELIIYYPKKLRSLKVITDEVANEILQECEETLDIIRTHKGLKSHVRGRLFEGANIRAKETNIPFSISNEDVILPLYCIYLGIPLVYGSNKASNNSPSLDKIIPELGYIPGNIQVISMLANTMKSNASVEMLLIFSKNILKIHGN